MVLGLAGIDPGRYPRLCYRRAAAEAVAGTPLAVVPTKDGVVTVPSAAQRFLQRVRGGGEAKGPQSAEELREYLDAQEAA